MRDALTWLCISLCSTSPCYILFSVCVLCWGINVLSTCLKAEQNQDEGKSHWEVRSRRLFPISIASMHKYENYEPVLIHGAPNTNVLSYFFSHCYVYFIYKKTKQRNQNKTGWQFIEKKIYDVSVRWMAECPHLDWVRNRVHTSLCLLIWHFY